MKMDNQIKEGDYIRCIYGDDSELFGLVLQVSKEQWLITVRSNGVLTLVNALSSNLDMIEVEEDD
jgi:ribosomal protein L24